MSEVFEIRVNHRPMLVDAAMTVAAAILQSGAPGYRLSVTGEFRGPLCGMGICAECRATIDGVPEQYACQRLCQPGMRVETEAFLQPEGR